MIVCVAETVCEGEIKRQKLHLVIELHLWIRRVVWMAAIGLIEGISFWILNRMQPIDMKFPINPSKLGECLASVLIKLAALIALNEHSIARTPSQV